MSVWLDTQFPTLSSNEGELVSVSVEVEARDLEALLEALARVSFPVNPQIYHDVVTIVEFPAYAQQVGEVREALAAFGFDPSQVRILDMLSRLRAESAPRRAAAGQNP